MKREIAEVLLTVAEAKRESAFIEKRTCSAAMEVFLLENIKLLQAEIKALEDIIKEK
jgi:hypothetical protein